MPKFPFMSSKKNKKNVPKKASSMNNIYNDYSGKSNTNFGNETFVEVEVEDQQQWRGDSLNIFFLELRGNQ